MNINSKIVRIIVQHNEDISAELVLKNIKEKKIIYITNSKNSWDAKSIQTNLETPAIILNSSGSMNVAKRCIHTIHNLDASAISSGAWLKDLGIELENCFIFNTLPLNHISGLMPLWRSKQWNCKYISIPPQLIKKTNNLYQQTISLKDKNKNNLITSLVPTQLNRLLKEGQGIAWLKLFDVIWIGGSSISKDVADQCRKEKIKLAPCYGTTETAAMITCLKPSDFLKGNNTLGEPLKDIDLKINQKSLITIKSKRLGSEYISPIETKPFANIDGWWASSDLGEITTINHRVFLKFLGRADNAFQSGGETVYPEVIKKKLKEIIASEKLPIINILICLIEDEIWENKFEVYLDFEKQITSKRRKVSLKIIERYCLDWPRHERPTSLKIKSLEKKNSWKDI
tara:strand:+ start:14583 stop:15782 length:1200 start_codon:yes stop_codon:yes gene_type:complete